MQNSLIFILYCVVFLKLPPSIEDSVETHFSGSCLVKRIHVANFSALRYIKSSFMTKIDPLLIDSVEKT